MHCPMGQISQQIYCPMGFQGYVDPMGPISVLGYCPMGSSSVPWDQYPDPLFVPWAQAASHGTNIWASDCPMGSSSVLWDQYLGPVTVPWDNYPAQIIVPWAETLAQRLVPWDNNLAMILSHGTNIQAKYCHVGWTSWPALCPN